MKKADEQTRCQGTDVWVTRHCAHPRRPPGEGHCPGPWPVGLEATGQQPVTSGPAQVCSAGRSPEISQGLGVWHGALPTPASAPRRDPPTGRRGCSPVCPGVSVVFKSCFYKVRGVYRPLKGRR